MVPTAERERLAGCSNIVSDPEILRSRGRTLSPGTFPHPPAGSGSGRRLFAGDGVFAALTLRAGETNGNAVVIATLPADDGRVHDSGGNTQAPVTGENPVYWKSRE